MHDSTERDDLCNVRRTTSCGLGCISTEPIPDLGRTCEFFGLYTFAANFGETGPDGACVEVESTSTGCVGAAVINGAAGSGRRRMTLAHELGHWLFGDAYDTQASMDNERMINSFAIHFLAPRAGVSAVWRDHSEWPIHDRALAVGAAFRLSWTATISQLRNVELISHDERERLAAYHPRAGDYLRLGLSWKDEINAPNLSPAFIAACLTGYTSSKLSEARVLEILRGVLDADDLPAQAPPSMDAYRSSFQGHPTATSDA